MKWRPLLLPLAVLALAACSQDFQPTQAGHESELTTSAVPTFTYSKTLSEGLNGPSISRIGPDGKLYVSNISNSTVTVFDKDGQASTFLSAGGGEGQLNSPYGLNFDASGRLFVADSNNFRIQVFQDGVYASTFASGASFRDVVFDTDGTIYSVVYSTVYKFKSDGELIATWDGSDSLVGKIGGSFDLAIDDSRVYVTDFFGNRVYVFDKQGNTLAVWQNADGTNKISSPLGITVGGDYVYVAESQRSRIIVFDKQGEFVTTFGSYGSGNDQFTYPWGVNVVDGKLYVTDHLSSRIQVYDINTKTDPMPEPYTIDFEKTAANKLAYSVKVGTGVTYQGQGSASNATVPVVGKRASNGRILEAQVARVVSIYGSKRLIAGSSASSNTPNAQGGRIKLTFTNFDSAGARLTSITLSNLVKRGAYLTFYYINGSSSRQNLGTTPAGGSLVVPLAVENLRAVDVYAPNAYSVDDVKFEVAARQ